MSLGKLERNSESYRSQKNIITRAVGIRPAVTADFFEVSLKKDDCVLLCSDGLSNMAEESTDRQHPGCSGRFKRKDKPADPGGQ